ncbi:MAG: patatin-like phospholipase family protein [Betaproteobacteria bacterium]|nr:patatin-like phospholipase family protein [Betaproteobacteria bacterium]
MKALRIYAGPVARASLAAHGLQPQHVATIPGAAGGPKGLILGAMDRFLFGEWLPRSDQAVDLVGASIGAWRMATACLDNPEVLNHPRYRLHIVTSRGRHLLHTEHGLRTPLGYLGAFLTNTVRRKAMGAWLERVVFSSTVADEGRAAALPFATSDYRTRQVALSEGNFNPALQASCSIPFVLRAIQDIPGAPKGAYWDGGITDYHLHLNYPGASHTQNAINSGAARAHSTGASGQMDAPRLVLYPHFQKSVVPGWLDKGLKWRHRSSPFLDTMVVLAPNPDWVKTLPNSKLPDRTDFTHYGNDLDARVKAWTAATRASQQMVDEFIAWLDKPDMNLVHPL